MISTSYTPIATGGAGVNPLSSYQYRDVGVNVDMTPTVTLDGDQQSATIGSGGLFSATFDIADLSVSDSPYTVSYSYAGDGILAPAKTTSTLAVTPATPAIDWTNPAAITYGTALSGSQLDATTSVPGRLNTTRSSSPSSSNESTSPTAP